MDVRSRISTISALPSADQNPAYQALIDDLIKGQHADLAQTLLDHFIDGGVETLIARPMLSYLSEEVKGIESQPDLKSFCMYGLEKLKRNMSFSQADHSLKMNLAECYLQEDCFAEAAETLARIDLAQATDKSARFKANINVRCAELFMDESVDDCGKADMFVRKAQTHIQRVDINEVDDEGKPVGLQIHLRYRFVFAKVLDAKRNFLQAAHQYYRITTDQTAQSIEDDDIMNILRCALTCAVLGTAGPQRTRILGVLHKDVRTHSLQFHGIMASMYKNRLLRSSEIEPFAKTLLPHQKAMVGSTGKTVLEVAVLEHNVMACSMIYTNISFGQLGDLLEVTPFEAEKTCSKMIAEKRLVGTIDQVDQIVYFGTALSRDASQTLINWDKQISSLCYEMNELAAAINKETTSP